MAPKETLWPIGPHTPGKHMVLRSYLNAWLPVITKWNERVVFIDGFAGPGEYEGGEDGSPIIAVNALREHSYGGKITAEVLYVFVEGDADRAKHLDAKLAAMKPTLPANCTAHVVQGAFDETMSALLDQVGASGKHLAPAFVMVDPFGVSDTPMSVLARILKNPKSELYISLMYEAINRHKKSGMRHWMLMRSIHEA